STLGADYPVLGWLGRWNPRLGSPVWSLLVQALITIVLILGVGTDVGRAQITKVFVAVGVGEQPWQGHGGFETLLKCTSPVFWMFFVSTGFSLFVLRFRDREVTRPFSVPLYPVLPLIFCGMCLFMLYSSAEYAKWLTLVGVFPVALGIPFYWLFSRNAEPLRGT